MDKDDSHRHRDKFNIEASFMKENSTSFAL